MDSTTIYMTALAATNMYQVSVLWTLAWTVVGFVCGIVFWLPLVKQFADK